MIKKNMNILYKEITSIKRKLVRNLKFFGAGNYRNDVDRYTVFLKNGSYFDIFLGTNNIPDFRKKDVAYICKYSGRRVFDTDKGSFTVSELVPTKISKFEKYGIDVNNRIDTGEWD